MDLVSVIRRWHFRDKMSIREIARRTGLSRNTVKKYLDNKDYEPKYPKRKTASKLDAYEQILANWLTRESKRKRKQRRSVKQLYSELIPLDYTGSYDRVAAFARQWRLDQKRGGHEPEKKAFIPLSFQPGEAFQFDWSEEWHMVGGRKTKLQVAHFKLSYSRAFFLKAYSTSNSGNVV